MGEQHDPFIRPAQEEPAKRKAAAAPLVIAIGGFWLLFIPSVVFNAYGSNRLAAYFIGAAFSWFVSSAVWMILFQEHLPHTYLRRKAR